MAESGDKYVLRAFTLDDYEKYSSWWSDAPPLESLPMVGLVSGDMKAVGFLARTDCDFSIITFWYANPSNSGKESYYALREVMGGLINASRIFGKNKIFCYSNNRGIVKMLESFGFINHTGHLIAEL